MLRPDRRRIWLPERPETYDKDLLPGNAQVWVPRTDGYSIGIREAVNINSANGVPYQQGPLGLAIRARPNTSTLAGECAYWNFTSSPVTRGSGTPSATMVAVLSCENLSYAPYVAYGSDSSGNGWSLRINLTPTTITGSYVDTSPAGYTATITRTQRDGEIYAIALRKVGATLTVFCNGQSASVTGGNGSLRASGVGLSNIPGITQSGYSRTYLAALTDVALTDAQIWTLLRDPRRLFPGAGRRVWAMASGGSSSLTATLTDAAAGDDLRSALSTLVASLIDGTASVEIASTSASTAGSIVESASSADIASAVSTLVASLTEGTSAAELLSASMIAAVTAAEAAAGVDISSTGTQLAGTLTESASAAEVLATAASMVVAVLEAGGVGEQIHAAQQLVVLFTESAAGVDIDNVREVRTVSAVDLAAALDVLSAAVGASVSAGLDAPMFARVAADIQRRIGASRVGAFARRVGAAAVDKPAAH